MGAVRHVDVPAGGLMKSWSEFLAAAGAVRPMIGISPDDRREAQDVLGKLGAHVVVATILQRSIHFSEADTMPGPAPGSTVVVVNGSPAIQSAGGYLRTVNDRASAGEFALGPVLMALIGQRPKRKRTA
jgi:replication initiation protein RepC